MSDRIIFMNNNTLNLNLHAKYVVGSEVGAKSRAVYRALKRRANNNVNGTPCCNAPPLISNPKLPTYPPHNFTTYIQFIPGNILTIFLSFFTPQNIGNAQDIKSINMYDKYGYIKQATGVDVIISNKIIPGPQGIGYLEINKSFNSTSPASGTGIEQITVNNNKYNVFLAYLYITFK